MSAQALISMLPALMKWGPIVFQTLKVLHDAPLVQALMKDKGLKPADAAEKALSWLAEPHTMSDDERSLFRTLTGVDLDPPPPLPSS